MANVQMQVAPAPTIPMVTKEDLPLPRPPALQDLPQPPPKEAFSRFHQQRQASELRRLSRHIHPELRKNLAEAVAEDLAEVLHSEEPTEGDVQCMRWIFENWRLDAIGDHEKPLIKESVPGGDVQATSRKFEEGSFASSGDQAPSGPRASGGDVRTARWLFETKSLDKLTGQDDPPEATTREPVASGDVRGTRMLFETRPLDRLGSRPSIQDQSPLELRSEIQELKGDVKKTVKLFQTEPLCAIQDAEGAIHEVKAACREEIHSNAVRCARWLFETQPLDAINRDPSQVRVIRGISLEEEARPDVSARRWIFETQPLDAIREIVVDEKEFQPSPDLIPPGPDVQQQRHLFETRALDTLKGGEEDEVEAPPKEEVIPGDVRSTLWLFETKPLDTPREKVQVGHLQRVDPREGEMCERVSAGGPSALPLSQNALEKDGVKGDVKTFKNLFETLPLDSIRKHGPLSPGAESTADGTVPSGQPQGSGSPVYAMQDSKGHLHALTSVSREQVVGGDVQGYRWMFETQPLDQLGRHPDTVDVVRGITRQEVMAGDVGTTRWLFETQPLDVIHQREQQERQRGEGMAQGGAQPETLPKGDVQTIRWLFETCPMSELVDRQDTEGTDPTAQPEVRSCTWMFKPQPPERPEGSQEQHLRADQVPTGERQTDRHVFETEPLQASGRPWRRRVMRYCSRVEIPSGQVSRQKEVFQALEAGKREDQGSRLAPEPIPEGAVHKFTWLFENCPMGSLAAESVRGDSFQEEKPSGPLDNGKLERQETATEGTLRTLHDTPGILHHGGILMEARAPGELCLAKYVLPGQGHPHVRKEELVSGELPRIVRQVLRRPDVEQQGLLVQEDQAGRLQLTPLRLPAPGSGDIDDLDPALQQVLACGLRTSVMRTGLVMQETEQGLVALTAYSLQPRPAGRVPERGSVQLLASCIDKGDLSGLHSLRWEPPADPSPVPGSEEAQRLPLTESVIHVPPLDTSLRMGPLQGPGAAACSPPPVSPPLGGDAVASAHLQGAEKKEDSRIWQKGMVTSGKTEAAMATPQAPGAPDLQSAMQGLRMATAEAQSLHQQILSKHMQDPAPAATLTPTQNGPLPAPAVTPGAAHSNTRSAARGDSRIPAAPRKVSGDQNILPGGRVTVQDGIYTAHPVRTFDAPKGVQPSKREPQPRDPETAFWAQASSPLQGGLSQSLGSEWAEPRDRTQSAWGPLGKARAGVCPGNLQAAETNLKAAPSAHHTLASEPGGAGASLHSHNASVPPPPLPAAVTGYNFPAQTFHQEDAMQQATKPLKEPHLQPHSSPAGQRTPEGTQTKTLTSECTTPPRKKPQLPPKPAYLSLIPPRWKLPKLPALSPTSNLEIGPGEHKMVQAPSTAGQSGPQHSLSTTGPRPTKCSNVQIPELPKCKAPNSDLTSSQQGSSLPGDQHKEGSQQVSLEAPNTLQGSHQELQGLLSQVQALEKEAISTVDVRTLRTLFEAVPQLGETAPQKPDAPHKPVTSVEQAFGELTRVSTEVAQLKEQTLSRLLDIEEAVRKALSSMSRLQPEANDATGRSQGTPQDPSAHKISVMASSRATPSQSAQEDGGQTVGTSQTEVQHQTKVRNHTEVRGQTAIMASATGKLETLREEAGLPRVLPSCRASPSSPTFISIQSAMRRSSEAPSPKGSPQITGKSTHLAQNVDQTRLCQEGLGDEVDRKEVTRCSGQLEPVPALTSPLPTGQQKSVLELQTRPGGSPNYGATKTVMEQYKEGDQFGKTILASSSTVTEVPTGAGPHLGLHSAPLLRRFLHSPAELSSGLEDPGIAHVPCGHRQPTAQ
ncbi:xin actin-binding repeat-containing protein 1 [Rhynchocyon petersi]